MTGLIDRAVLLPTVGIFVSTDDGREVRVRSLGPHTTIGEMGLMTGRPRSATVRAETASTLYVLPSHVYRQRQMRDSCTPNFVFAGKARHVRAGAADPVL